jgi:HPt (histidine-containing phosphotransfer) domain-containing protein
MSESSIDLATLNELKVIMEDEFDELVNIFISDGQTQIEQLAQAIAKQDDTSVRKIAHTLKGSSSNLGITDLSELCRSLEFKAAENDLSDADSSLQSIKTEYEQVKVTLEGLLNS